MAGLEVLESATERSALELEDPFIANAFGSPRLFQLLAFRIRERAHSSDLGKLRDGCEIDEQRVQPEGASGGVGARVARRGGQQWEQHPELLVALLEPLEEPIQRAEVTDTEIGPRAEGEQRKKNAGQT